MNIELTIKTDYLPNWGTYEGVRELIQNAKDAQTELNAPFSITHSGDVLTITNTGTTLPREALLLGYTTKRDNDALIGKFGEGLKLGILALVRAGHKVSIHNGAEVWKPVLRASKVFTGSQVLTFNISNVRTQPKIFGITVKIHGVDADTWAEYKTRFLFLADTPCQTTSYGDLLTDTGFAGRLYVKGIFVKYDNDLVYGYNYSNAKVDRDRGMVDNFDASWYGRRIWIHILGTTSLMNEKFVELLNSEKADAKWFEDRANELPNEFTTECYNKFIKQYGEQAWACEDQDDVSRVEFLGKRGIILPKVMTQIIQSRTGNIEMLQHSMAEDVVTIHTDFSREEIDIMMRVKVQLVPSSAELRIVTFKDPRTIGLYEPMLKRISINRSRLSSTGEFLKTWIHEVAHHNTHSGDGNKSHIDEIEDLWEQVYNKVTCTTTQITSPQLIPLKITASSAEA